MDGFWECNIFELMKYKEVPHEEELIEMSRSFIDYVKTIFPVNKVPENIASRISSLEERINLVKETYELCVESVAMEMQKMVDKGELK